MKRASDAVVKQSAKISSQKFNPCLSIVKTLHSDGLDKYHEHWDLSRKLNSEQVHYAGLNDSFNVYYVYKK